MENKNTIPLIMNRNAHLQRIDSADWAISLTATAPTMEPEGEPSSARKATGNPHLLMLQHGREKRFDSADWAMGLEFNNSSNK